MQWKSLTLEETPLWSDLLPRQVSMLNWAKFDDCPVKCSISLVEIRPSTSPLSDHGTPSLIYPPKLSLLGLMAKIKCSICSYQFNIWYAGHVPAHILIWFLAFGQGSEACFTLTTGCLGIALQPSAAHYLTNEMHQNSALVMMILRFCDMAILRHCDFATLRYCRLKFYLFQISEKRLLFWISCREGKL